MRTGNETFHGAHLRDLARKAMHGELGPDGGYVLLPDRDNTILASFLTQISPMRQVAKVRQISSGAFEQATRDDLAASGWVAERAARPETTAPKIGLNRTEVFEVYAEPAATQALLDDSIVDLEDWLAAEVRDAFALQEGSAFINGDGVGKPRGLLSYPIVTVANWVKGSFRYVPSGQASSLPAAPDALDPLVQMTGALKSIYRMNAKWMMNSNTAATVQLQKDSTGQFLWQRAIVEGQPDRLLGFPVVLNEDMPDIGTNTTPIALGDWERSYEILDRLGIRVLRDPYSSKPYVLFYTTKRVGGYSPMTDALILLKIASS